MVIEKKTRTEGNRRVVILSPIGKMTIGAGDTQIREAVQEFLGWNVVLNMGGITTLDSSGIAELVGSYKTILDAKKGLVLLKLPPKLKELLYITQLIREFEVYEDEETAVARFDRRF